jgi:hypothetical protein
MVLPVSEIIQRRSKNTGDKQIVMIMMMIMTTTVMMMMMD